MAKNQKTSDDAENTDGLPDRLDWLLVDQKISAKYKELLITKKKVPTIQEIADAVGCDRKTVTRHLEKLSIPDRFKQFKALTGDIMVALYKSAMSGDPKALELWFKYVEGISDKSKIELTSIQAPKLIIPGDD